MKNTNKNQKGTKMKIEVIFLDKFGDIDYDKSSVELNSNYDNRYILVKDNFIRIEDKDYRIHRIRGIYEESELVKMEVKVHCAYEGQF